MLKRYEYSLLFLVQVMPYLLYALLMPSDPIPIEFKTDDSYFYFKIAQNVVAGLGSTFDGINPTNGYHPLWMILCIPIVYFFDDKIMVLRIVMVLSAIFLYFTLLNLLALLRNFGIRRTSSFIVVLLLGTNSLWHSHGMCGMEFPLSLFLTTLFLYLFQQKASGVWFGLVGGLTFLVRLDNVFLICIVYLFVFFQKQFKKSDLIAAGITASLAAIYIFWNIGYFGHVIPVSGMVKEWWGQIGGGINFFYILGLYSHSISQNLKYWYDLIKGGGATHIPFRFSDFLSTCTFFSLLILFVYSLVKQRKVFNSPLIKVLFISVFIHIFWYAFRTKFAGFGTWYWAVEWIFIIVLFAIALDKLFPLSLLGKIFIIFLLLVTFPRDFLERPPFISQKTLYQQFIEFLECNTEPGSIIGMPACGIVAYYMDDRTFINVDGVTNSYKYLEAIKRREACKILRNNGMNYAFLMDAFPYTQFCKEDYFTPINNFKCPSKFFNFTLYKFEMG